MDIKKVIKLNSRTIIAQVHSNEFGGELPEVEKIAEVIGQYGNIVDYKIEESGNTTSIIYTLNKNIE